jgi:DNA-binding NarL/FixJ family response regulator
MRVAEKIELHDATDRELRVLSKRRRIEVRLQQRVRVILLAAEGWQNTDIASRLPWTAPSGTVAAAVPTRRH